MRLLGGRYEKELSVDTTHLIAKSTLSEKYKVPEPLTKLTIKTAISRGIHVVSPEWLSDCTKKDQLVPATHYNVPPLKGLNIAFSGFNPPEFRQQLAEMIRKSGGAYSSALTNDCTHLLVHVSSV